MLDEYIWGKATRISPEAPVMVVDVDRYSHVPGGAANVVNNICALGAKSSVVGIIGQDEPGTKLADALRAEGAETSGLVELPGRPTTRKTRVIAHSQQVVRVDHENRTSLDSATTARLAAHVKRVTCDADAILVSDYQKGVVSPDVLAACVRAATNRIPITGNLKPHAVSAGAQFTVITLNLLEARQTLGLPTLDTVGEIEAAGENLLRRTGAQNILVTRGAQGLTLFSKGTHCLHVPARPVAVYDPAGAGDTVITTMTLALTAGASATEAVVLANYAAAATVKKLGVTTVSCQEILDSIE